MVDAAAGQLLEAVQHQVAVGDAPVHGAVLADGRGVTAEGEQVRRDARHLELHDAYPLRALGHLEAARALHRQRIADFHRHRIGHADARHQRDVLDPQPAFHELLEAAVQIAAVGARFEHLVAVQLELERVVALDARMVGPEVQLVLVAGRMVDGLVVLGSHFPTVPALGLRVMPPPWASRSLSQSGW